MKTNLLNILKEYLLFFPNEVERQSKVLAHLQKHTYNEIIDWNNFDGHLVAGAFIYARQEGKFLVLYHNDLEMYLYPGGHIEQKDKDPLSAAKREVEEETGLNCFKTLNLFLNECIPVDIDTHIIKCNERLHLPRHYHFEFRYLFVIDKISHITMNEEFLYYKWINIDELGRDPNYGNMVNKIQKLLLKHNGEIR